MVEVRQAKKVAIGFFSLAMTGVIVSASFASPGDLVRTFTKPKAKSGDDFGCSIASLGTMVVVGDRFDDSAARDSGAVYLFDAATGTLKRTLLNPTPNRDDRFGQSLATSGRWLAVGAHRDDTAATDAGAVYVFDALAGKLQRTILNPIPRFSQRFGVSVYLDGPFLFVGASKAGQGGADAVHLFDLRTGRQLRTYFSPKVATGDRFGCSFAVARGHLLVGAFAADTTVPDAGAAYWFTCNDGKVLQTILNPTPNSGDQFGRSVAVAGETVAIGAYLDDTKQRDAGAAYLFDTSTGDLRHVLYAPDPAVSAKFGYCVLPLGHDFLVGSFAPDDAVKHPAAVYLFDGTTGQLRQTFKNPRSEAEDQFGRIVATLGRDVLVAAPNASNAAPQAGVVYRFEGPASADYKTPVVSDATQPEFVTKKPRKTPPHQGKLFGRVDNSAEGRRSLTKLGHIVQFDCPGKSQTVVGVQIMVQRFVKTKPVKRQFYVYLLNEKQEVIQCENFPYSTIELSDSPTWHTLSIPPTEVKKRYYVAVLFHSTYTNGMYLGFDRSVKEPHSFLGQPGHRFRKVADRYDWMIRVLCR